MESKQAFCHHPSSKLTQSIIKDHMVSHYRKLYSAKAAIDTSVPKSLNLSVKYTDQIKQAQLKNGSRPHSAHSVLQSSRASRSSAQSRLSLQYDKKHYLNSRSSIMSSPRFNTSFHAKEVVYPGKVSSQDTHLPTKLKHKSPEGAAHRKESPCSFAALGSHSPYRAHRDPMKKTYSGDLLQKHSHVFSSAQAFTPKILKSDKTSCLSKYRYYRAPQRKPQDFNNSRLEKQKANLSREETSLEYDQPSQEFSDEPERSEEEFSGPHFSASRGPRQTSKSKDCDLYNSLFRDSPEETVMKSVYAYEEELACLQFISTVTSDILSREYISNRVLDMVFRRHFDMNLYHLKEDKMCHLLENLRKDIYGLNSLSVSRTALERDGNDLHVVLPSQQLTSPEHRKSREDSNLLSVASLTKYLHSTMSTPPILASTPFSSSDRSKANEKNVDDISQQRGTGSPQLSEHGVGNTGINEAILQQEQLGTTWTNTEDINLIHESTTITTDGLHPDQAEASYSGQPEELEDLGWRLSKSLHMSSDILENNMDVSNDEQYNNTNNTVSVSDDEF
ncbi:spermatogenesis-associated protein 7 homolog isoform X2 [Thalassophryne amazonica]|uniref:spermatogenesis-associated protein 7 homolog isoform X2 n=1 Tax=Thalassophryne amazonica TaxID=390379 RepID=UPI0014718B9E|nr:spermatogenesis-associated protein 7 homolog isoform X2 [Thalassophryne amazonica]